MLCSSKYILHHALQQAILTGALQDMCLPITLVAIHWRQEGANKSGLLLVPNPNAEGFVLPPLNGRRMPFQGDPCLKKPRYIEACMHDDDPILAMRVWLAQRILLPAV